MASSYEWAEYPLTPSGWLPGSRKTDFGYNEVEPPADRGLSYRVSEAEIKPDRYFGRLARRPLSICHSALSHQLLKCTFKICLHDLQALWIASALCSMTTNGF